MKNDKSNPLVWVIIALVIIVVIFTAIWVLLRSWYSIPENASAFGDSFGFANSIFSALAFAGLIIAIFMQKKELELQREELSATKNELAKTAKANQSTSETLNTQSRINAKQALLVSYQSRLSAIEKMPNSEMKPVDKRKDSIRFLRLIRIAANELEKENSLFLDSDTRKRIQDIKTEEIKLAPGDSFFF